MGAGFIGIGRESIRTMGLKAHWLIRLTGQVPIALMQLPTLRFVYWVIAYETALGDRIVRAEKTKRMKDRTEKAVPETLLVFLLDEMYLAMDVRCVREVARSVRLSVPALGGKGIRGMITLRGEAVAVADLGEVLGISGTLSESRSRLIAVRFNSSTVCFLTGKIQGLLEVDEAKLDTPPPFIAGLDTQLIDYITWSKDGGMICVINMDEVFANMEKRMSYAESAGAKAD